MTPARLSTLAERSAHVFTLLLIVLVSFIQALGPVHASPPWSSPILVDSHPGISELPSSLQASNGTLWIVFESNRNAQAVGRYDLVYKTYTNGLWSADHNLTTSGQNVGPSLLQLNNGTIGMFWSLEPGSNFDIYYSQYGRSGWSAPVQITASKLNDTLPSAAVAADGTLWLTWTRVNSTDPNVPALKQIYYKTWKSGAWSPEVRLTTDVNQNYGSSIMIGKDGIVRVTWSKGAAGSSYEIFEKTFNGTMWSLDTQLVSSSSTDEHPSMIQDRNGTFLLFWGRLVVVSQLVQYYVIYCKYSYDLGRTWSSEIQLTPTPVTGMFDSFQPTAIQSSIGVKPVWVFYTSNYNQPYYDIYAIQSTGIYPVHDMKITRFAASNSLGTSWVYPGGLNSVGQSAIETVTATVANVGDYVENVTLTMTATNQTSIILGTIAYLIGPENSATFYFYWNTTNAKPGRYGLSASIASLPGETLGNLADNSGSVANMVHILPLGDTDQDGSVTITDVSVVFYGFGFTAGCGCDRWNPYAAIDGKGIIDIIDVGIVLAGYNIYT